MYQEILATIRKNSDLLENRGYIKQAYGLDLAYDLLAKVASNPSAQSLKKDFGLPEGDLDKAFLKKVKNAANSKGLQSKSLGDVGDSELLFIEPKKKHKGPNLLIISGMHGDEQAGPFGVLRYLERINEKTFDKVNLSFLPLFNPTGFRRVTRRNQWDDDPNRNYKDDKKISVEGKIIKDNLDLIKSAGKDGMITIHEDPIAKVTFIYIYHGKKAEELGEILLGVERMFFKQRPAMPNQKRDGRVKDGIVWDRHEGSLEDWLRSEGIPQVVTTETPGKMDFEGRVQANTMLLNAFVDFHIG